MERIIRNESFRGERPLFGLRGTRLENVRRLEGESGVKCCFGLEADGCEFIGKYPLWHVDGSVITGCRFRSTARSAVWYSRDMVMRDTIIDAPKLFREMENLRLTNVVINDADETFWNIKGLTAEDIELHGGRYPFMYCTDVRIEGLTSDSLYIFQYCRDVEIHNARIKTKDALWECDNVTVYDSELDGEYLGWHSRNVRLVRCRISGEQPLCYMNGVTIEDCTFDAACDRAFEDSFNIDARICGSITNIKNPASGRIVADRIGSATIDGNILPPASCEIGERKCGVTT
ncbi:MAG: DUF3737 family protein [Prevotella sp.]|nr:DUF3737 family protein [Prevotella sp.]